MDFCIGYLCSFDGLTSYAKPFLIILMPKIFLDQKGAAHLLLPLLIIVVIGFVGSANVQTTTRFSTQDVKGLVAKSDDRDGSSQDSNSNSGRGNSSEQRIRQEIRTSDERIKTEIREDRIRIDIRQENSKTRIQQRGNEFLIKTKIEDKDKDDDDEATESGEEDEDEATESAEEDEDEGEVVKELRAISKFPLRIDLATNQLIMTKNGVSRVLTVLPAHAVQNMLRAHLKKGLGPKFFQGATPSAQPSTSASASPSASATPSASPTEEPIATGSANITILEDQITLEESDGQIVYKIPAKKHLRVIGLIPVDTNLTGFVSAQTGALLEEQESLLARILDLLSP